MKCRKDNMEARFAALTRGSVNASDTFDCSVIAINLVELDWEDRVAVCRALFTEVLGIEAMVTKAERLKSRNNKPGLTKCQLSSLTEKIKVLHNKRNVADNRQKKFISPEWNHTRSDWFRTM